MVYKGCSPINIYPRLSPIELNGEDVKIDEYKIALLGIPKKQNHQKSQNGKKLTYLTTCFFVPAQN